MADNILKVKVKQNPTILTGDTGSYFTANNGLTKTGNNVYLGGDLTGSTTINVLDNTLLVDGQGSSSVIRLENTFDFFGIGNEVISSVDVGTSSILNKVENRLSGRSSEFNSDGGNSIKATNNYSNEYVSLEVSIDSLKVTDTRTGTTKGIQYAGDYSSSFGPRSLVDKGYVTGLTFSSNFSAGNGLRKNGSGAVLLGGGLTGDTSVTGNSTLYLGTTTSKLNGLQINTTNDMLLVAGGNAFFGKNSQFIRWLSTTQFDLYGSSFNLFSNATNTIFTDQATTKTGIQYFADYSANYATRSLVDKGYVTTQLGSYLTKSIFNTFTGTTAPATYLSKSAFSTYSGTTAVNQFANKAIFNSYTASTSTVTSNNGLTKSGNNIHLGGTLTGNTTILGASKNLGFGTTSSKIATLSNFVSGNYTISATTAFIVDSPNIILQDAGIRRIGLASTLGVILDVGSDSVGDMYYRSATGVLTRLGIGATGYYLKVAGGLPVWASGSTSAGVSTATFNGYTGTTAPATYLTKSAFNIYSGTTEPATYAKKATFNTYTGTTAPATYAGISNDLSTTNIIPTSTITLNLNSYKQKHFIVTGTTVSTTLTFSNTSNVQLFSVDLTCSGSITITMPSTVRMQNYEVTNSRWNSTTRVLTLAAGKYTLTFSYDNSVYRCNASDLYV